ncbi:MAG: polyprenyl synthetase family protein [Elusimicrobia bacterium]|nr:polyprenyl synthetase family protein [Elusimicrobiota bacterium]
MTTQMDLKIYLKKKKKIIDNALKKYFSESKETPPIINTAMKYSIFAGGKRLRPVLCLAAGEICGGSVKDILPTACAIEMIHTYSLIHDDLPAMDDDDYRRGKLTSHKKYGEAIAILAGDGLLTKAFEIIHPLVVKEVAVAAGTKGMVGGQVADIEMGMSDVRSPRSKVKGSKSEILVRYIHEHKTAKMIEVSLKVGAILSNASQEKVKALSDYGRKIGLAFQVVDDILDITGNKKKLGKKGSDIKNKKLTYPSIYGIEKSKEKAIMLIESAKKDLNILGKKATILKELADYIVQREY